MNKYLRYIISITFAIYLLSSCTSKKKLYEDIYSRLNYSYKKILVDSSCKNCYCYSNYINDSSQTLQYYIKKYGVLNQVTGKEIIPPIYSSERDIVFIRKPLKEGDISDKTFVLNDTNKTSYLINHKGRIKKEYPYRIISYTGKYFAITDFNSEIVKIPKYKRSYIEKYQNIGLMNKRGKIIMPMKYDFISFYMPGIYKVSTDTSFLMYNSINYYNLNCLIDKKGDTLISAPCVEIENITKKITQLTIYENSDYGEYKYSFVFWKRPLISIEFKDTFSISILKYKIKKVISGDIYNKFKYFESWNGKPKLFVYYNERYLMYNHDSNMVYYTTKGKEFKLPPNTKCINCTNGPLRDDFCFGLTTFEIQGKNKYGVFGLINKKGKIIVPPQLVYEQLEDEYFKYMNFTFIYLKYNFLRIFRKPTTVPNEKYLMRKLKKYEYIK